MKVKQFRRCTVLFLEPVETIDFSLGALFSGGDGLSRKNTWRAIAPHLEHGEVALEEWMPVVLGRCSPSRNCTLEECGASEEQAAVLLEMGLLISMDDTDTVPQHHRQADERVRAMGWWPLAVACALQGRWSGIDSAADMERNGTNTVAGLIKNLGMPAPEPHRDAELLLPRAQPRAFDQLLRRRVTCRNFSERPMTHAEFALMMERVFAATHVEEPVAGLRFLKRSSPSGGGFHATDAYLLIQGVNDITPGLYSYLPQVHGLNMIRADCGDLATLASQMVAGQHWFSNAPVMVVLAATYRRSFWKYRNHSKAHRALVLDSGHLSQTLYLSATDLGLGAFVTAAINEKQIEQMFDLDPLEKGVVAVCGFGHRSDRMTITEFDPGRQAWPAVGP